MKYIQHIVIVSLVSICASANAQKTYNEGTITYNIAVVTGSNQAQTADLWDGATQKLYFKNQQTRTELKSLLGTTITLHDSRNGSAVVMNEYDQNKVLIRMTKANYEDGNKKYAGIKFELKNETKTILGYKCGLAIAILSDGSTFKVYYTTEFNFQNKDYGPQFNGLPGVPLEYESEMGKMKVTYMADKVSFEPVGAILFDVPKSGYREMTYEEVQRLQKKN
jgi:GLPGLI family protein